MCTNLVHYLKNDIFAKLNRMKMVVVSSREFRANQRKYFDLALTNDVVITYNFLTNVIGMTYG